MTVDATFEFTFARIGLRLSQLANHAAVQGHYDTDARALELLAALGDNVSSLMGELCAEICKQADLDRDQIDEAKLIHLDAWRDGPGYLIRQAAIAAGSSADEAEYEAERRHQREESRPDLFI